MQCCASVFSVVFPVHFCRGTEAHLKWLGFFSSPSVASPVVQYSAVSLLLSPLTVMNWQLVKPVSRRSFNKALGTFCIVSAAEKQKPAEFALSHLGS